MDDLANAARHDTFVPSEITRLVGQKYKLMVSISKKWKLKNTEKLSFQVNRIEETFKPALPPIVLDPAQASSSGSRLRALLPALGPVMSPTAPQTPVAVVKLSPSTPVARSSAPMRGARRSLFQTTTKYKAQPLEEGAASNISGQAEVGDGASGEQIGVGDGTVTAQDRVGETLPLKDKAIGDEKDGSARFKRTSSTKSGGTLKKGKP
uniref:Uncharacterized protein n=1 Tax=Avena sativa TaxID=4498 RepID=A0ACD6AK21_AVESA